MRCSGYTLVVFAKGKQGREEGRDEVLMNGSAGREPTMAWREGRKERSGWEGGRKGNRKL